MGDGENIQQTSHVGIPGIPNKILQYARTRSNRNEKSRFPYKIWALLSWAGSDQERMNLVGCGWKDDIEFFINKARLCVILDIKLNTLNGNLKQLGFEQKGKSGEISFWKNNTFSRNSSPQDFEQIRNVRCTPNSLANLSVHAVYLPLLEPLQLYSISEQGCGQFKKEVVEFWETLVGNRLLFAVSLPVFTKALLFKFEEACGFVADYYMVQQVLAPKTPNVISILDFAVFLARFGPFKNAPYKIIQYQQILSDIRQDFFIFNTPSLTSYFSMTFHNCFRFQLAPSGEYHCYNLPDVSSNSPFLIDEDGTVYKSWQMMLQANHFLAQRM